LRTLHLLAYFTRLLTIAKHQNRSAGTCGSGAAAAVAGVGEDAEDADDAGGGLSAAFVVQTTAFLALTGGFLYFCVCELQRASRSGGGGGGGGARVHPAWAQNRFKLSELVYYRLDYWLSISAWTKPAALLAASYLLIFVGGAAYRLSVGAPFSSALWSA